MAGKTVTWMRGSRSRRLKVFGKNPVAANEINGSGLSLRVVGGAPWFTIQGEGPFAGDPAVFLRLHGCPLRCFFCDTEFSNPNDPEVNVGDLADMIESVALGWCKLLVITGGEPVRQNLSPLINIMVRDGWTVQIETSGIMWQECLMQTVVICSPKTPVVHPKILENAHGFKYVIRAGETDPEDGLPVTNTQIEGGKRARVARPRVGSQAAIYLSPMDEGNPTDNSRNAEEVARIAMMYGYRAGLQLHKFMNVP
jgi:organic radical activating enzyme